MFHQSFSKALLLAVFIFVPHVIVKVLADCDAYTGPSGTVECVLLQGYYGYQWATCLTNTYIQLVSGGNHICADRTRTYCYYQCMIEVHGEEYGSVYSGCSCSPGDIAPTTASPKTEIPEWCYSPDGTDCSFYRECLEKRYPCSDAGNSYALSYGEKFCNLYQDKYSEFTTIGQQWIDAVRKCLQVALVPLLRPFENPTCADIENRAFDSHTNCYINAYTGAPSICDIGLENWLKVIATVSPALNVFNNLGASLKTLAQSFQVMWACTKDMFGRALSVLRMKFDQAVNQIEVTIDVVKSAYATALKILNLLRAIMNIEDVFIQPFIVDDSNRKKRDVHGSTVDVDLLIVPRAQYDLDYNGNADVNVSAAITYFLDKVERKEFTPDVYGGVVLKQYSTCDDYACSNPSRTVQQPSSAVINGSNKLAIILAIIAAFLYGRFE